MSTEAPILVLGGSGFIGSSLLSALVQEYPQRRILVLAHNKIPKQRGVEVIEGSLEKFDWSTLDTDPPSNIFHLARINSSKYARFGRYRAAIKGKRANKRLLHHIDSRDWNTKITYVSGSLMYGNSISPQFENAGIKPISFAREYAIAELPFLNPKLNVQMIRLPWVYGNNSWFKSFFLNHMQHHREVPCYGDGTNQMSFIEVNDAARAILFTGTKLDRGTYNLSIPGSISQMEFCQLLSSYSGLPLAPVLGNQLLKRNYESAIYEAFTSNIVLDTLKRELFPDSIYRFNSVEQMLESTLVGFLKNE